MILARWILGVIGVTFVAIGAGFLVRPVSWAAWLEIALPTATARTDLRATYGGFDLAFGIFLLVAARRADWVAPGLVANALALGGFAAGRLLGFAVERSVSPRLVPFLLIELAGVALSLLALRRLP